MKKLFFIILIAFSLSSCMMMMPGHMAGSMHEDHNIIGSNTEIDPVCGKPVDEAKAFSFEYQKNIYYFDTEQCLSVFKNNPDHFLKKSAIDPHKKTWARIGWIGGGVIMTTMMLLMLTNAF